MIQIVLYRILRFIPRFVILPDLWKARTRNRVCSCCWIPELSCPNLISRIRGLQKRPLLSLAWCTHTHTNTVSTYLLGLIREYNGWLLTRKGLSAFKLVLFTTKISLLNLIQIFYENYHYRFEVLSSRLYTNTRSMRLPRVFY